MVTKSIDALTARTQFGAVMKKAIKNQTRFMVNKRGKPQVVIIGIGDYLRNFIKKSQFFVEIQEDAIKGGLDTMSETEINAEIKSARKTMARTTK